MKAFHFPLQRVLEWRQTKLQIEERNLMLVRGQLHQIEAALVQLRAAAVGETQTMCRATSVDGSSLGALAAFHVRSRKLIATMQSRRTECLRRVAAQEAQFMEARRQVRLLEKLKDRRHSEWQRALDKELESTAVECHLAKLSGAGK